MAGLNPDGCRWTSDASVIGCEMIYADEMKKLLSGAKSLIVWRMAHDGLVDHCVNVQSSCSQSMSMMQKSMNDDVGQVSVSCDGGCDSMSMSSSYERCVMRLRWTRSSCLLKMRKTGC